jgi:hypothetical protein
LAQINFNLAESLALAAALIFLLAFGAGVAAGFASFTLAHLFLAAAEIFALAAALILNFFFGVVLSAGSFAEPKI